MISKLERRTTYMTTVTPALQSALLNLSNVYVPSVPSARGQNRGVYYTSEDFLRCGIMLIAANGKLSELISSNKHSIQFCFFCDK